MGKSVYSVSRFDEIKCVDAWTLLAGEPKYQLPPTSSCCSKQTTRSPAVRRFFTAAKPEGPAPTTQ